MIKKPLALFAFVQIVSLSLLFLSKEIYTNFIVAQISAMLIIMGSLYAYRKMIEQQLGDVDPGDSKDAIDVLDDPYDLYEEEREEEIQDIKGLIKEEKAKQAQNMIKNTTKNGAALVSAYRMIPYAVLVLGFVSLENNGVLAIIPFLVGLAVGIGSGYWIGRDLFISQSLEY